MRRRLPAMEPPRRARPPARPCRRRAPRRRAFAAANCELPSPRPEHNFTRLVPDLSAGEDPDDAFSRIPYEKGCAAASRPVLTHHRPTRGSCLGAGRLCSACPRPASFVTGPASLHAPRRLNLLTPLPSLVQPPCALARVCLVKSGTPPPPPPHPRPCPPPPAPWPPQLLLPLLSPGPRGRPRQVRALHQGLPEGARRALRRLCMLGRGLFISRG
jgi:hypothetical protein